MNQYINQSMYQSMNKIYSYLLNTYVPYTTIPTLNAISFFVFSTLSSTNMYRIHNLGSTDLLYGTLISYNLSGYCSACIHWFMDTHNTRILKERHEEFRNHHSDPTTTLRVPIFILLSEITYFLNPLLILTTFTPDGLIKYIITLTCIMGNFSQITHRFSHKRNHKQGVPSAIKYLQDKKIILHPDEHRLHHEKEIVNYSILHSNSDRLFEFTFFRLLHMKSSLYKNNNTDLKQLSYSQRTKLVPDTSLQLVIFEQFWYIMISIFYWSSMMPDIFS
jgi:hypothetical protein